MGWHCDDEPLFGKCGDAKLIVSVSLGSFALFRWRRQSCSSDEGRSCRLDHGDLLVMDGQCQDEFLHCTDPGREQERINVTFRWIKQHVLSCPLFSSLLTVDEVRLRPPSHPRRDDLPPERGEGEKAKGGGKGEGGGEAEGEGVDGQGVFGTGEGWREEEEEEEEEEASSSWFFPTSISSTSPSSLAWFVRGFMYMRQSQSSSRCPHLVSGLHSASPCTPSIRTSSPREEPSTANSCWLSRARGGGDALSLTPRCSATLKRCMVAAVWKKHGVVSPLSEPQPPQPPHPMVQLWSFWMAH